MLGYNETAAKPPTWRQRIATLSVATIGILLMGGAVAFAWAGSAATQAVGGLLLATGLFLCALSRTNWLRLKIRVTVVLLSFALVIVVADICLRATTRFPINTAANTVQHPQLGYTLNPDMPDVDADGFRNDNLKTHAAIVTIGDSQTQGPGVPSLKSWPQVLGKLLDKSVYNLGVEGYGPLQYETLIDDALKLQPKTIVVGLYVGNDFADASQAIGHREKSDDDSNPFRRAIKCDTAVGCLCHHVFKQLKANDEPQTSVADELNPTVFSNQQLKTLSAAMDLSAADVRRGFLNTLQILDEANRKCVSQNCRLVVLVIPTREFTYSSVVDTSKFSQDYQTLVVLEREVHERLAAALRKQKIAYASALPSLQAAMKITHSVYAETNEACPRESGHVAYAAAVVRLLSPTVAQR